MRASRNLPCRCSVPYLFCHGLTASHRYATASIPTSTWLLTSSAHPCYRLPITHLHNLLLTTNAPPGPPAPLCISAPVPLSSVTIIARSGTPNGTECHLSQLRKGQNGAFWGTFSDSLAPGRPSRMTVEYFATAPGAHPPPVTLGIVRVRATRRDRRGGRNRQAPREVKASPPGDFTTRISSWDCLDPTGATSLPPSANCAISSLGILGAPAATTMTSVRSAVGPAKDVPGEADLHVSAAERAKAALGGAGQSLHALHADHAGGEPGQHGRLVAAAGAHFQRPVGGAHARGAERERDDVGLGDALAVADGQGDVLVGELGGFLGHEEVPGDALHRAEDAPVVDLGRQSLEQAGAWLIPPTGSCSSLMARGAVCATAQTLHQALPSIAARRDRTEVAAVGPGGRGCRSGRRTGRRAATIRGVRGPEMRAARRDTAPARGLRRRTTSRRRGAPSRRAGRPRRLRSCASGSRGSRSTTTSPLAGVPRRRGPTSSRSPER